MTHQFRQMTFAVQSPVQGIVHDSAVQCSAVQCSAVQCSAVQCSAVQCSAVQCSAVQCSAVQCSAVQCCKSNSGHCLGLLQLNVRGNCGVNRKKTVWDIHSPGLGGSGTLV